jgi:hypothetical protein
MLAYIQALRAKTPADQGLCSRRELRGAAHVSFAAQHVDDLSE